MKEPLPQVENRKKAILLSLICFLTYSVSYMGRLNYSAALAEMIASGVLTRTQGGAISTIYFLCYGGGQLVNGALADRHNPVWQVGLGIAASSITNMLMPFATGSGLAYLVWGANGYFQSLIWAPAFLIVSQSIPPIWRNKALLLLNTAAAAGSVLAYASFSLVLKIAAWRHVFYSASGCLLLALAAWMTGCSYAYRGSVAQTTRTREKCPHFSVAGWSELSHKLLISGGILLILPAMVHGMLKDGITNWLPTYLTENFSMTAQAAVATSVVLPVINMLGAVIVYFLMQWVRQEIICTMILFSVAGGSLLILRLTAQASPVITILCLATVTAMMMGINVLLCSEVPTRFAGMGRAATISGFYNSCGYIGTAVSMYAIAWVSERFGWQTTQTLWLACCVTAVILCGVIVPAWSHFLRLRSWHFHFLRRTARQKSAEKAVHR